MPAAGKTRSRLRLDGLGSRPALVTNGTSASLASSTLARSMPGLEQIRAGLAWHYKAYEREQSPQDRRLYAEAEEQRQSRAKRIAGRAQSPAALGILKTAPLTPARLLAREQLRKAILERPLYAPHLCPGVIIKAYNRQEHAGHGQQGVGLANNPVN